MLKDKVITIGISSSIAAYKIPELIRLLQKKEAQVRCILTPNATKFVAPGLLEALTKHKVYIEEDFTKGAEHIELAQTTDLFLLAPLSANTLNKISDGIADNLLTTTILATRKPILVFPAMNEGMWENPIVQKNFKKLSKISNFILKKPVTGELFCGQAGIGKLEDLNIIALEVQKIFTPQILEGKNILISLGATHEKLDPVRFISNYSSGLTGYALARTAYLMGANVTIIKSYTKEQEKVPYAEIQVKDTSEMLKTVKNFFPENDIFVSVAAISDFKPEYSSEKIKSGNSLKIKFTPTPDILKEIHKMKTEKQIVIGFALETEDLEKNAYKKLKNKKLDFIVANEIENLGSKEGEYFLIGKNKTEFFEKMEKEKFGFRFWREVALTEN